jgi:hypothetical protein
MGFMGPQSPDQVNQAGLAEPRELPQTIIGRLRIDVVRWRPALTMRHPITVVANLIHLSDQIVMMVLEWFEHMIEAAELNAFLGFRDSVLDRPMVDQPFLRAHFVQNVLPDNGLEDGK